MFVCRARACPRPRRPRRGEIVALALAGACAFAGCGGPGGHHAGGTDAATDASTDPYGQLGDSARWSSFDVTAIDSAATGFRGAVFDGHDIYFVPGANGSGSDGIVARFSTGGSLSVPISWSTFDTTTVDPAAKGFLGGTYDGRYVYLAPFSGGVVARFDKHASFTDKASWSTFDITTVDPAAKQFAGAAFDGRYVYLVPSESGGVVARYDTQANFTATASWSTFDTTTVNPAAAGFFGAIFDGRYLYLIPGANSAGPSGIIARYDTQAKFTDNTSWSTFDTTTVDPAAKGFRGGAFDDRYLYLVPYNNGSTDGVVARYDIRASFTDTASWSTFDTTTLAPGAAGFFGAAFDGRYVYFVPGADASNKPNSVIARYDLRAPFTDKTSWSTFDTTGIDPAAKGFAGAAFDGGHIFLVPDQNGANKPDGVVTSYYARRPRYALPPLCSNLPAMYCFSGSFL